jgi:hypothetical protein
MGASANAIAFSRWYYSFSQGEDAFIEYIAKPLYGVVSVASIERPGRASHNLSYLFVNGVPPIVSPDDTFAEARPPWANNAAFLAIKRKYPSAWVFPDEAFVGESVRPGGGQRFTISVPIVHGCHACTRIGVAYLSYGFDRFGTARDVSAAIHACPSSDVRCNR